MLDGLFRRIVWSRVHYPERELRLLEAMPGRQLDVAVDVGAALGSYAWVLNRKARTVFAFEPGAKHFAHLEAAARWSHVEIVRAALGAETGTARLHTPGDSNEARHMATLSEDNPVIRTAGTVSEVVPVYALDVFLQDRLGPGRRLDLLKIDVEGFENSVLEGAEAVVSRDFPIIIAEIERRHNPAYRDFFDVLCGLGYRCKAFADGAYRPAGPERVAEQPEAERFARGESLRGAGYVNNFVFQHQQSAVKVIAG